MRRLLFALLIAAPLQAQLERTAVLKLPGMESVEVRKDIVYDGDRKLDLYRPKGDKTLPLVIFLNGVGVRELKEWGQYTSWPRLAAVRGMAAITYETTGEAMLPQAEAVLAFAKAHAAEWKIDPARIAVWACSANARVGTAFVASHDELRAAVFYYGLMEAAPKNSTTPVFVARAGLDAPNLNQSIDRWVAQAVTLDAPVTLVTYPEGPHAFDVDTDTPESRQIIAQTLDFLQFHLTTAPTPRREPMTLAQLQQLIAGQGIARGMARLQELAKTHPTAFVLQERSLNSFGYSLLAERKLAEATGILELVAAMNPVSANAYDSLADAYEAAGRKADAIAASRRALQLLDKAPERSRAAIRTSAEERLKRLQ